MTVIRGGGGSGRSLRTTKTMRGRTTTTTARTLNLSRRTPAGLAEPVSPPSQEAFRRHVLAGICPFCGLGPYSVLAIHTSRAHAIDKKELRERAGLFYSESITSPEYHAEKSAQSKKLYEEGRTLRPEDTEAGRHTKHNLSPAAVEQQRQKAARAKALYPDIQQRMVAASMAKTAERTRPLYKQVVETYEIVVGEQGMAYGAVKETAARLGWPEATTLRRIEAAWALGMGTFDRTVRGSEEHRICRVCDEEYVVTRTRGWKNKTCSAECGAKLNGLAARKPPRTGICKICGNEFTYIRGGTAERVLCDSDACRREVSRRAGQRTPSAETRKKISEARRATMRPAGG